MNRVGALSEEKSEGDVNQTMSGNWHPSLEAQAIGVRGPLVHLILAIDYRPNGMNYR